MINQFIYDGIRSYDDMGLIITETPPVVIAERDLTMDEIPARDGSIVYDNDRFKNVSLQYKVAVTEDRLPLRLAIAQIAAWLGSVTQYKRIWDTYDPDFFRLAIPAGAISFSEKARVLGIGTIRFSALPWRFSVDGERAKTYTEAFSLFNPYRFPSSPVIKVTGAYDANNVFYINDEPVYISTRTDTVNNYRTIDCENRIVYVENEGQKELRMWSYPSAIFPALKPGINTISLGENVTEIEITPNWRTL